ncbi:uroporphyrinogen-III C-methyltransferase [Tenggerimyces flavus]|uniref:Uroporphyrinogen-III C-methyltransferase n=1 Tax=Tenggerimyces flavus TaxID=1708749 RepID=A0ABV7YDU3_9ACTN|nr:uroporphyrinogen-III C-methyltransferase [Tenggerimyces flavus]MBM7787816.1 uroporphyrin-III C-methyltransferase/precorrin-2 dehydrogenase/sirohydrochlorin ferrochelatase [Tenggerimyces flavus]
MSEPTYPLLLDIAGRRVVVVGGGPVAARRVGSLLAADALVTVVAPALCEELSAQVDVVAWVPREYVTGDLSGAWLVHTATGDQAVDALVAADAEAARVWCVRAGAAEASSAWTPAVTRVDDVTVAVSAGGDPRRAQAIRARIATSLATGDLPTRRQRRTGEGHVALIGGGPGDPGLITTRGRRLLADADVVVVDRLAPRALLDELDPAVEVVEAGKGPLAHTLSQLQINELIVERALAGQRVVRLKGGDPFVFGRGAEEALACAEAGVPCEVVPGVTSAVAVPEAAGIPVTHRNVSRSFTVISGHVAAHGEEIDWTRLAPLDGTLVFLMGVAPLADVAAGLVRGGRSPELPVAIVERGTLPSQRTTFGTLATIADLATERGVRSPAVIIVGDVVDVAAQLGL